MTDSSGCELMNTKLLSVFLSLIFVSVVQFSFLTQMEDSEEFPGVTTSHKTSNSNSITYGIQEGSLFQNTPVAAGNQHSCVLSDQGAVYCWGANDEGQLGDGTQTDSSTPVESLSLGRGRYAVSLAAGDEHTCAILDNGSVKCWGDNSYGQLGDGSYTSSGSPRLVSNLSQGRTAVSIQAGATHTCAVLDNGSIQCWGNNQYRQLAITGNSAYNNPVTPSLPVNLTVHGLALGDDHTCVLAETGRVMCWGDSTNGQMGAGYQIGISAPTWTNAIGVSSLVVAISAGAEHNCALLDNGSTSCWG
jgi:alpha-tubulin suppressor-like RCC1 family protein